MAFKEMFDIFKRLSYPYTWNNERDHGIVKGWPLNEQNSGEFQRDIFYINSLLDSNGDNLYEQFINKNYFEKLKSIKNFSEIEKVLVPPVLMLYEDKDGERHLVYDWIRFVKKHADPIMILKGALGKPLFKENVDQGAAISDFKNLIVSSYNAWNDLEKKGVKSEYFYTAMFFFTNYVQSNPISFEAFVSKFYTESKILNELLGKIGSIYKKEILFEDLLSCFDYDKFCLIICKSMLDQAEYNGDITPTMQYCVSYFSEYKRYQKNHPEYNPRIYDYQSGKLVEVDAETLYKKYSEIMTRHTRKTYDLRDLFENAEKFNDYIKDNNNGSIVLSRKNFSKLVISFLDKIEDVINEDKEQGAKDATEEINKKVEELEKEIQSESISLKDRKEKTVILKKIKMVLNDIKPKAIQTGTGKVFKNYYVYYYPNGMVALDRIDGYGALYIMPVHIYSMVRYKDSLTEVRYIPGVISINHKNRKWLEIARNSIENGTEGLTEDDMKKSSEVASVDFPYTLEELEKLEKSFADEGNEIGVKETKRRIRKAKELEKIDAELKENEFDKYEIYPVESREKVEKFDGEREDALTSEEIDEIASSDKPFEELYEYWKNNQQKEPTKRNPVVAGITKRRTLNEQNHYCCEWCKTEYIDTRPLRSHHVIPLCKGGPDNIYNTVCICPNCHDFFHSHEMTMDIQSRLFDIIKHHIEEENPEYLPNFYEMLSPVAKDDEDYEKRKDVIDSNFAIQWKDANIKKR